MLEQYDPDDLGSFIGYLPQQVTLFSGTVAENIARMSTEFDEARVIQAAQRANAHQMILSLPDGYQTMVHGKEINFLAVNASALACPCLYNDPSYWFLMSPIQHST